MIPPQIDPEFYWKCSLSFHDKCSLKGLPYAKQLKRTLYIRFTYLNLKFIYISSNAVRKETKIL